jgi:hypothetical protein
VTLLGFEDANVRSVVLGSMLLGAGAGVLGSFTLLRKRALLGDALAQSAQSRPRRRRSKMERKLHFTICAFPGAYLAVT